METLGNRPEPGAFRVTLTHEQGTEREHVAFEHHDRSLALHFESWARDDGGFDFRNSGFTYSRHLEPGDDRDVIAADELQRVVDQYPYWLNLARAAIADPAYQFPDPAQKRSRFPNRTLKHGGWKPSQPGRSPAFLEQLAEEYVRRFDAGENAVTAMARTHGVKPGTMSKWLTKANDPRVEERRTSRYRRNGETR